ncbi:MAG: molybdopterin-synthase adenylyltransferase MoeB [Candidatus Eremiobacteraeota bacterium]|nr:molybdopterin-synthase adenylyltransferase MoeB [Candidatus Eremiobacteraeota bacterium]
MNSLAGRSSLRRYSRHLLIPQVGLAGQERLASARVLCVGAGGLGAPVLSYLAAAGVGRIGVMDDDTIEETNLQRQTLFTTPDIGRPKVHVVAERLGAMNPQVAVDAIPLRFERANAREMVRLYDIVIDCTDSFESRYLINDACILEGKPDIFGSIFRFDGQVSVFGYNGGPCYRCLFPDLPGAGSVPSCAEGGVLGVLAGMVGTFQANEALKVLLGIGEPLTGRLLLLDALHGSTREIRFERDARCAICSANPTITELSDVELPANCTGPAVAEIEPAALDRSLESATLLDVREPHEAVLGILEGAVHIPVSQLEARMHELDTANAYVVACRVGRRSLWAVQRLHDAGFRKIAHLRGGLLAYAALEEDFMFF